MIDFDKCDEIGPLLLSLLGDIAQLGVDQIWIEKSDFDCILAATDYGAKMQDFEQVCIMPENIIAFRHTGGMFVKCAQIKPIRGEK